jgi:hypothetical protein
MTPLQFTTLLFLLLCGHFLADFTFQTEWIATNKNRHVRLNFSPEQRVGMQVIWPWLLTSHAMTHGLMVFLITNKLSFAFAEVVVHWLIDFGKCEKWYGFHADQILHVAFKVLWACLIASGVAASLP